MLGLSVRKGIDPKREPDGQYLQKIVSMAYHAAASTMNNIMNFEYQNGLTLKLL